MKLDRIDLTILDRLQTDGRATSVELADAAGLSASPAHRRQKLLEERGVITGYVALLDQERVGLPVSVFVNVELDGQMEEHLEAFEAAVRQCPEIMECYIMTGSSDYLLRVVASDLQSYEAFLRTRLTRMPHVRGVRSAFALKRVVYRTSLPLRSGPPHPGPPHPGLPRPAAGKAR